MAKKATKAQKDVLETLSYIDSLVTILGDYPEATLPLSVDVNPFGFLINVCKSLGIYDELLKFLVKLIQYELPLIELGVKGILLANLKEVVSCSSDPFIPNYMRKQISSSSNSGITFTLADIDYNNLMDVNPLADGSEYYYLGIPRKYHAWYMAYSPKTKDTLVHSESSKDYKTQAEAENWVTKKITKLITKYPETDLYTYDITGNTHSENRPDTKKGQDATKLVYIGNVDVKSTSTEATSVYVFEEDNFDTYAEAESFITKQKNKNSKKYKKEKTPIAVRYNIENVSDTTPYELARAKDFNAYLWFVTHMADFNSPIVLNTTDTFSNKPLEETKDQWSEGMVSCLCGYKVAYKVPSSNDEIAKSGPLGVLRFKQTEDTSDNIPSLLGTTFQIKDKANSATYDLCIKGEFSEDTSEYYYTIVPATSDRNSLNWYGDRSKYFDFLKYYASPKKEEKESPRNYYKEIGICNLEFDSTVNSTAEYSTMTRNVIRFTVLPKPLVHIPQYLSGEMPWNFKMILFNTRGEFDSKGKFSVFVKQTKDATTGIDKDIPYCQENDGKDGLSKTDYPCFYVLANKSYQPINGNNDRIYIPKKWSDGIKTVVQGNVGTVVPLSCLYECYPNLTIYEFNYDYIMSQRLFDPKVIAGELISGLLNMNLAGSAALGLGLTHNVTEGTIRQVIIDMIEGDADVYASNDCFSSFSNEKYDTLLNETEQKKAQGYHFEGKNRTSSLNVEKINEILSEYDNPDITQEGQVDVLNRAFQEAMVSITAETEDTETWDIKFNIISQLIMDLVFNIVKSILTPKILMLIAVNKQLMGGVNEWTGNILENLLSILLTTITQIIKEIKDMLLKQLLEFVLDYLKPKFEELAALIIKEYTEQYRDQIKALISACGFGWGKAATADTQLDKVTYADIDPIEEITTDNVC